MCKNIINYFYIRFNLIWKELWNCFKICFCLWCYYPTYRGALFIDDKLGKKCDPIFDKILPIANKVLGLVGVKRNEGSGDSAPSSRKKY